MLVFARRLEEEIVVGECVRIKVLKINEDNVKLGITAPKSIRVDRGEIDTRRKAEQAAKLI